MKSRDIISDEQLNAFVDGELEPDEENRIFTLSEQCPELDARLCRQRKLKELVQHSYRDVPGSRGSAGLRRPRNELLGLTAAAIVTLAIGLMAGWFAARTLEDPRAVATTAQAATAADRDSWLLHISSSDPQAMEAALARAEALLSAEDAVPGRRVEVVANEGGIDLLRSDQTPFAERIRELAERDVLFFACTRAIERLEESGVDVRLVPQANPSFTALDRVALRLQKGWSYQRI
jgi:intracellular sulfur oxidation DsrE/DsrF family protein